MTTPAVTVLMPMYNAACYLDSSVGSILAQTFENLDFLIINDCSTDDSVEIIRSFHDPRIRLVQNDFNIGVAASMNKGLTFSAGKYIVRMDSDDISHPDRIRKQVEFMEAHPEVGISGTWVETIGDEAGIVWKYATNPATVRAKLFFSCCLAQPSVIMRKDLLQKHGLRYDKQFVPAEDWELWIRASFCFSIANLPEVLVQYRIREGSLSRTNRKAYRETIANIHRKNLFRLGIHPDADQLVLHDAICGCDYRQEADFFARSYKWLQEIVAANRRCRLYPEREFEELVSEKIIDISPVRAACKPSLWCALVRLANRRIGISCPRAKVSDR
jgi:glycosyltransferase involved in cell wall biosynthesis